MTRSVSDRFWEKVRKPNVNGCWLWNAAKLHNGYGVFARVGASNLAHRASYEMLVGSIPEGLVIDHLCGVKLCVNPSHMETVTQRVNVLRGNGLMAINAKKTHCPQGHEYSPTNTIVEPRANGRTMRRCRICRARHSHLYYQQKKRNQK